MPLGDQVYTPLLSPEYDTTRANSVSRISLQVQFVRQSLVLSFILL